MRRSRQALHCTLSWTKMGLGCVEALGQPTARPLLKGIQRVTAEGVCRAWAPYKATPTRVRCTCRKNSAGGGSSRRRRESASKSPRSSERGDSVIESLTVSSPAQTSTPGLKNVLNSNAMSGAINVRLGLANVTSASAPTSSIWAPLSQVRRRTP